MRVYAKITDGAASDGDWSARVEAGSSTMDRISPADFPDGLPYARRSTTVGDDEAYVQKTFATPAIPSGGWVYIGMWMYLRTAPIGHRYLLSGKFDGTDWDLRLHRDPASQKLRMRMRDDVGSMHNTSYIADPAGLTWLVIGVKRSDGSNNGEGRFWYDDVLQDSVTGIDNDNQYSSLTYVRIGMPDAAMDGFVWDFGDVVIADSYPRRPRYRPRGFGSLGQRLPHGVPAGFGPEILAPGTLPT